MPFFLSILDSQYFSSVVQKSRITEQSIAKESKSIYRTVNLHSYTVCTLSIFCNGATSLSLSNEVNDSRQLLFNTQLLFFLLFDSFSFLLIIAKAMCTQRKMDRRFPFFYVGVSVLVFLLYFIVVAVNYVSV